MKRHTGFPIIVGGCFRSGTSLVRRLLNAHSRIYCGPEVKFFRDFYGDYFSDPLKHLRFTSTARSMLSEHELFELLGKSFVAMHERAAIRAGKARWADKNPENVLYLRQWHHLLGSDWLFVQVVRNPLDTLASIKEAGFPLTIPSDLNKRISIYVEYVEAGLSYCAEMPSSCYLLRYEKLVSSPEKTIGNLMAWLGEDFEPEQLHFNQFTHQTGLEDPKVEATASIHSSSVGRWKSVLTQSEAELVLAQTRGLWAQIRETTGAASIFEMEKLLLPPR